MILREGQKGDQVKELQRFLNESFSQDLNVDGHFGPKTTEAVKYFQRKKGLTPDGIFGPRSALAASGHGSPINLPSKLKTILVSAGHTNVPGQDRGVAGSGYIEGVEAVKIRDAVAARLRLAGHKVREDGEDGVNEPLAKALALIAGTDIAVEFHFNGGVSTATGIEVLSMPNKKADAQRIAAAVQNAIGLPLRGEKGWKSDTSGQHPRLGFCRRGGLIVEICFMSNIKDMAAYQAYFAKLMDQLAEAIGA